MGDIRVIEPYQGAYGWEGWGTCLYWWANTGLGTRDDLAGALFGLDRTRVGIDGGADAELSGLGLNVVRYNLGACTFTDVDGQRMAVSPRIPRRKQIEGYWNGGGRWDRAADPNQRTALEKARGAGADTFELASVSPLWWMTGNGDPCGAGKPSTDNLRPGDRANHAAYLAAVARMARDEWGVRFTSVEPFNEPSAAWWTANGKQEGCHFTPGAQQDVLSDLRAELDHRGLDDVRVAASDEYAFDQATVTWSGLPGPVARLVGRVNVHGYQGRPDDPGPRRRLRAALGDTPLWQSEYGDGDPTGLTMARNLSADLHDLRPLAWVLWQPVEHSNWGLFAGRFDPPADAVTARDHGTLAAGVAGVRTAYHVFAQYTRHIRPNARILDGGHRYTVAGYDEDRRRLALVTVNPDDEPVEIAYDLGRFRRVGDAARVWTTDTADPAGRRYERSAEDARTHDGRLVARHGPRTVTTFELDGVDRRLSGRHPNAQPNTCSDPAPAAGGALSVNAFTCLPGSRSTGVAAKTYTLISSFVPSELLRYGVLSTIWLPNRGSYASAPSAQSLNDSAALCVLPSV
jgi:galactan endo-1,6-beta-galactosidase